MELRFTSPVPLRKGCKVSYWFPTAFYDASEITELRTGALFSMTSDTYTPDNKNPALRFEVREEADDYKSLTF